MALTIDPWSFPDAEFDPKGQGEKSIVLGGGCFWCMEAVFKQLDGVTDVRPGYAGGTADTADYRTVCGGRTDHAEVVEVAYDAGADRPGRDPEGVLRDRARPDPGGPPGSRCRPPVPLGDLLCRRGAARGGRGLHGADRARGRVRRAARRPRWSRWTGVLRGRGLSPRLRRAEPGPALYPRRGPAQGAEVRIQALLKEHRRTRRCSRWRARVHAPRLRSDPALPRAAQGAWRRS